MRSKKMKDGDAMKKGIYILPNLFTTAGIFFGFYSIIVAMNGQFGKAAILIMIAAVLDALDGKIARFTNTTSRFGVEYDSLSDLVSFGVAPALLVYLWALAPYGRTGWIIAFLFMVCGALRLARFNVQATAVVSKVFVGFPIPGAAMVVATTILFFDYIGVAGTFVHPLVPVAMVCLSLLMVSNVHYYSFKDLNFFARKPFITLVLMVLIFVIIVMEPQIMLFVIALSYCMSGPSWLVYRVIINRKKLSEEKHEFGK